MSRYQLDGYAALTGVRNEFASFLRSTFRFADPALDEAVHRRIEESTLLAPPVVEATFPYEEPAEKPRTLRDLADAGVLHPELPELLEQASGDAKWPKDRALYTHQVASLKSYREGKSIIVASGTGSGKTECFLLPTIDTVLRDENLDVPGVRVLLVYPLNALVNNQMDRLRAILGSHPKIRFALYTRRLPESEKKAERALRRSGRERHSAEIISRETLRARPPHIIVTNFSMLEYALVRPADATLFTSDMVRPRLCVLDEAHVYAGSLAAEITMLLRRAWLRWGMSAAPQGIVTSATMHQGVDDGPEKLHKFTVDLLSKLPADVVSIAGRRIQPPEVGPEVESAAPDAATIATLKLDFPTLADAGGTVELSAAPEATEGARAVIAALGRTLPDERPAARALWEALEPLSWVRRLRRELHVARAERVDEIAARLFPDVADETRKHAVFQLLTLLAMARRDAREQPLLPVRIHGVMRGPHGLYACMDASCERASVPGRFGALHSDLTGRCACGAITCEIRVCEACGQSYLSAEIAADDEGVPALIPAGRDVSLFVPGESWDDGTPVTSGSAIHVHPNGRVAPAGEGLRFTRLERARATGATRALDGVACPKCEHLTPHGSALRRIESGTDASLQVIVDGLYPSLPRHPDAETERLPGEGRRALLFADNRQTAAALAAKIEESHDVVLGRTLLVRALDKAIRGASSPTATTLQLQLVEALRDGRTDDVTRVTAALSEEVKKQGAASVTFQELRAVLGQMEELSEISHYQAGRGEDLASFIITRELGRRPARAGNLEASGVVVVDYAFDVSPPSHPDVSAYFADRWPAFLHVLLDVLRTSGIVFPPALSTDSFKRLPRGLLRKALVKTSGKKAGDEEEEIARRQVALIPASAKATTRTIELVEKILAKKQAPPTVQPSLVLEQAWEALGAAARKEQTFVLARDKDDRFELLLEKLRFRPSGRADQWRCSRCQTIWAREVHGVCPTRHCGGELRALERGGIDGRDRLVVLSRTPGPLYGLRTEEHTAQIGVDSLEDVEDRFKRGCVNVLTSSTTMELGIDIGGLSATLLTNVPPGPSNYLQRAGRAGRRAEGTSLVLTFARPRPYDQAAFEDPRRPFRDKIIPPVVRLETERIIQRHVNAFLLALFFRGHAVEANGVRDPMSALRTVEDFFFRPIPEVVDAGPQRTALASMVTSGGTLSDAFEIWCLTKASSASGLTEAVDTLVRRTALGLRSHPEIFDATVTKVARVAENVRGQRAFLTERMAQENAREENLRDTGAIKALELQLADLAHAKLLGFLAEEQFLPRYGFPVQVVSLDHRYEGEDVDKRRVEEVDAELRLARDIALAINEYAPGAEVVAAKHVHRSSGVLRHWTGQDIPGVLTSRIVAICQECGGLQYGRNEGEIKKPCVTCGDADPRCIQVLEPRNGFAVLWGHAPERWTSGIRPPLRPVAEAAYAAREGQRVVEVSPGLSLGYDDEGQILLRAEGQLDSNPDLAGSGAAQGTSIARAGYGYAVCWLCGRSEPETQARGGKEDPLPRDLRTHQRLRGDGTCESTSQYWRHIALAGAVRTETLSFQLRGHVQFPFERGRQLATTWMVALQLAAGEVLGIDSRGIGGLLVPRTVPGGVVWDALLYDQLAGGAGHCRTLLSRWRELVEAVRARLTCANDRCANGCHRCLIAFETQRYEETLRRSALLEFLEAHWEEITRTPEREGVRVEGLVRGRYELLEAVQRSATATVSVLTPSVGLDALDETGWLRALFVHAERKGRVRLLVETLPDPDDDAQRFLARRLGVAAEDGRVEVRLAKAGTVSASGWRLSISDPPRAYFLEGANDEGLGPRWVEAGTIFRACDTAAITDRMKRIDAAFGGAMVVGVKDLEPEPPPPTVKWRHVLPMEGASRATFEFWLKNAADESLFARPLAEAQLIDPYIASEWQLELFGELCGLLRKAGCKTIRLDTYPPEQRGGNVSSDVQLARVRAAIGKVDWRPMTLPQRRSDAIHKRLLKGVRQDGTKFEVLFERGIDFIVERRPLGRTTRETFIIVRDPA